MNYSLELGQRTHVMGILNVTPDSFSDGGRYLKREKAIEHGIDMARDGADIIDVGGESTRPYSKKISIDEERERVIPVIEALSQELNIPICIDTFKSEIAKMAMQAGASMINDISAFRFDPDLISVVQESGVPVILMHMKGTPDHMQDNPIYDDLIGEILDFLNSAVDRALNGGINKDMIIIDPGIGFGKTFDHNLEIINALTKFDSLGRPILLGTSRKAFIGHILDREVHDRDTGTMATIAAGVMNGAHIIRVHDVKKGVETVKVIDAIKRESIH
ncbi:MAG: dihydropteroate synthase [Deltaproteobacteria bacterium]|nr:dihydropteroate synthase [Deltaproteobacteria bacterium]